MQTHSVAHAPPFGKRDQYLRTLHGEGIQLESRSIPGAVEAGQRETAGQPTVAEGHEIAVEAPPSTPRRHAMTATITSSHGFHLHRPVSGGEVRDTRTVADVFILGAGFSHAVDRLAMPTTADLGARVIKYLSGIHRAASPGSHSARCDGLSCDRPQLVDGRVPAPNFEAWLSRLAEPQPYRHQHENEKAHALFTELADGVAFEVLRATEQACGRDVGAPEWFKRMVRLWHQRRSHVVTFNYDTLVEALLMGLDLPVAPGSDQSLSYRLVGPPLVPSASVSWTGVRLARPAATFTYMKLHGSIHWYWDAETRSAESMVEVGLPAQWGQTDTAWEPDLKAPGKSPVIIPPTTSKGAFFVNPVIRHLWRGAFDRIRAADRIVIVGYSLPAHDELVASMLTDATRERGGIPTIVVNPDPDVARRAADLGLTVVRAFESVDNAIGEFVDAFDDQ